MVFLEIIYIKFVFLMIYHFVLHFYLHPNYSSSATLVLDLHFSQFYTSALQKPPALIFVSCIQSFSFWSSSLFLNVYSYTSFTKSVSSIPIICPNRLSLFSFILSTMDATLPLTYSFIFLSSLSS